MKSKKIYIVFTLILIFTTMLTACKSDRKSESTTKTSFNLDTINKITAYGPNASEIIDEAFNRISEIEQKMTSHGKESEIICVNEAAGVDFIDVSPDTFYVIEKGLEYSKKSQGRFDITIGPLVNLWGIGTENEKIPSQSEINEALELVNYNEMFLDKNKKSVMLRKANMSLDLGAIAKGYAADEAVRILRESGVKNAVIDLGGNIFAMGNKPDGKPWRVGIQDPFSSRGDSFATVEVSDKTLVTSGPYERFFEKDGKKYHHILDPDSGYPVHNELISSTIISSKSIDADGISTAAFALGLEKGMEFVENLKDVEVIFVTKDYNVYTSSGVSKYNFKILDDKYKLNLL